jgi:hypothetical protein
MFGIGYFKNLVVRQMSIISKVKSKRVEAPKYSNGVAGRNEVASRVILYEPQSLRDWLVIVI